MLVLEENLEIGNSLESFQKFLQSQKDVFHSQIDQLQSIVVTQCKLTGVNPLSQEMAAGALSVEIGKRPRDLLNPKAVKYMQALFSIKDAVSKKESREISAKFGITVTQVRDFFNTQRTRVRRLVRLSREKAVRADLRGKMEDHVSTSSLDAVPLSTVDPNVIPLESFAPNQFPLNAADPNPSPLNFIEPNPVSLNTVGTNPVPINTIGPSTSEETPSCSMQSDILPGLDEFERNFVENIFVFLRKEESFSGQVKLMEQILRIQNPSVLNWFLDKGGVMILVAWLTEAAAEEQTSFLLVTLDVLCHLPLQKACPEHKSAILHSINRLRFYRSSDISNRAWVLLSKWTKMFARSQAVKKPNGVSTSTDVQAMILKKSIDEIMGDELWEQNASNSDDVLTLPSGSSDNVRKMDSSQPLKLLPAPADDPSRKQILGGSSSHGRERRKVQLVEQPGQKISDKKPQAVKAGSVNQSRPMSADDIQKAKMRALHMQNKYGKPNTSSNGNHGMKIGGLHKPLSTASSKVVPISKVRVLSKIEEHKKPATLPPKAPNKIEVPSALKQKMDHKEPSRDLSVRVQISWHTPPEVQLNEQWRIGTGENSKEVDVQRNRNRREMETKYRSVQDIPFNPKEPWDQEMDYDDTLTPVIPIEQSPDADSAEPQHVSRNENVNGAVASTQPLLPQIASGNAAEPDIELLAVLLKNPELVFALTSGQAGNLSSQDTVKLLDMIKVGGGSGLSGGLNGVVEKEDKVEVSLPSPTPSSNPGTSGWRPEVAKNPFSQRRSTESRVAYPDPGVSTSMLQVQQLHNQTTNNRIIQHQSSVSLLSPEVSSAIPSYSLPKTSMVFSSHHIHPTNSSILPTVQSSRLEFSAAIGPSMRVEAANRPAPLSYTSGASERGPGSYPSASATQPTRLLSRGNFATEPQVVYSSRPQQTPESWRGARQGLVQNSYPHVNQNSFDASFGGRSQSRAPSVPSRERDVRVGDDGFESWSPENSPGRSPVYTAGRNYPGHRMNPYIPDNRPRPRNPSGYRDHNWDGNQRWR